MVTANTPYNDAMPAPEGKVVDVILLLPLSTLNVAPETAVLESLCNRCNQYVVGMKAEEALKQLGANWPLGFVCQLKIGGTPRAALMWCGR